MSAPELPHAAARPAVEGPVERTVGRPVPKRDALCARVMDEIDSYIKRYDVRGPRLADAASDVCDGWVIRAELQPLLDARRLRLVGRPSHESNICGSPWSYWTVALTQREIDRRWSDRKTPNVRGEAPAAHPSTE